MKVPFLKVQAVSRHRAFIYGTAALMIMFFHFGTNIPNSGILKALRILQDLSCCGVEMFLLLTGFGLVRSLEKEPSYKRFCIKRLLRVIPPLIICALAFDIFIYTGPLAMLVRRGFLVDYLLSSAVWYVSFITVMYLLFPLIEKIRRKSPTVIWIAVVCFVVFSFVIESAADFPRKREIMRMLSRIPVFLLGCALAPWERENRNISPMSLPILVPVCGILIAAWRKNLLPGCLYSLRMLCFTTCAICIIILLTLLAEIISKGTIYRFIAFCGGCSLEIYLVFARIRAVLPLIPIWGSFAFIKMDFAAAALTIIISALIAKICIFASKPLLKILHRQAFMLETFMLSW